MYIVDGKTFSDIADAIREKTGKPDSMTPLQMPDEIRGIQGGGIELAGLIISKQPNKTAYKAGETFDPTGMVVEAVYDNGATLEVDGYTWTPSAPLTAADAKVTIQYNEAALSATATVVITVAKNYGSVSLEPSTVTLGPDQLSTTVLVTRSGTGAITAQSNDQSVCTVSVLGDVVTVQSVNETTGNTTVTVSVAEDDTYLAATAKLTVQAKFLPEKKPLNDMTWEEIRTVVDAGQHKNYFADGDTKMILVNGFVGTEAIVNTFGVFILGLDHNQDIQGTGITFGGFKSALSGGVDVAFVDSNYGQSSTSGGRWFNMNHSANTNVGGWSGCDIRYDILGSTKKKGQDAAEDTATNPLADRLMTCFPKDLRTVMSPMTIYTDNVGGGSDNAQNVTETVDYLPLMAEFEVFGERTYANTAEQNYQKQFDYYKSGNSKVRYKHNDTGTAASARCRSVHATNSNNFCLVYTNGSANHSDASNSWAVAPIFFIGHPPKKSPNLTIDPTSLVVSATSPTATITVTRNGDGAITAEANNTNVIVSVEGTTITVQRNTEEVGSAFITVRCAETDEYKPATTAAAVLVNLPEKKPMDEMTWADITTVAKAGQASNYFEDGDAKEIVIDGVVGGGTKFNSISIDVFVLSTKHNEAVEGENLIHLSIGRISGKDVALVDSMYGNASTTGARFFNINQYSATNAGGWKDCGMRHTIFGNTRTQGGDATDDVIKNPISETLMTILPSDLRAVMTTCTKWTDNVGGGTNAPENVTATQDSITLASEFEVYGAITHSNPEEQNHQEQYSYYKAGNSKVRYKHSSTDDAADVWTRSSSIAFSTTFVRIDSSGNTANNNANISRGISPIIFVGGTA